MDAQDIQHRSTRVHTPRTNGFVERMNRTLLDQCFRVEGRKTWHKDTAQLQSDVDRFLDYYNLRRTHQRYRLNGRTPVQAFAEALGVDFQIVATPLNPPEKHQEAEADIVAA